MKTLIQISSILIILFITSCTPNETIEEIEVTEEITPKNVEIILTTSQPNFDEVVLSYFDFDEDSLNYGPRQFVYDANGNPEPIIISLPNYKYKTIEGNAYRKNNWTSSLKVQIFIDDILVKEDEVFGTNLVYAQVFFDYTIEE